MEYLEYTKMIKLEREINSTINPNSIYKDIDLAKDIDIAKSGFYLLDQYYLDDKIKSLRFIYTEKESLLNYKGYFGRNPNNINLFNELNLESGKFIEPLNVYIDTFISEYSISNDDIIYFSYENGMLKDQEFLCLVFNNEKFRTDFGNSLTHNLNSNDWEYYLLGINSYLCSTAKYSENAIVNIFNSLNINKYSKCIIDFKQNIGYINNKRFDIELDRFFKDDLKYISICKTNPVYSNNIIKVKPDNLMIGNRNGYIYLNPIEVRNDMEFKLKIAYNGNIKVECYSESLNKWVELNQDDNLKASDNKLNLRFKVSTHDEIYKVVLLKA